MGSCIGLILGSVIVFAAIFIINLFVDVAFPDLDVDLLFKQEWDGIEDTDTAEFLGMYLKPSQWFKPVYGRPAHPFCN